ncbi:MAG: lipopolysaccharide biosynthesis protein [Planctomycetota bacterium]|jgi:PST family polysaccharide transporter
MATTPTFRHAVKWAYVMTWGQRGIALLLTFILAAILDPEDFGTVAMAAAYILFIELFVAQGMAAAIIQRKNLDRLHLDSVFWLLLGVSLALCGASVVLSPLWAEVNHLPRLAPVIAVLSLSVPIRGLTVLHHALLQREMAFRKLAMLSGVSSALGGTVGVAMALAGGGVWSLVTQQLVTSALATAAMWHVSDWRPRLRFSWRHVRSLLGFSGGTFASQLGVYVASQADAVIIGLCFGPVTLGLYRLADRIMRLLLEVATRSIQVVALPHFSKLQDDPDGLRQAVLSCVRLSASVTVPAMAILACVADPLMALLGERWTPAAAALRILVFLGIAKALTLFTGPLLLARGRVKTSALLVWTLGVATALGLGAVGATMTTAGLQHQMIATASTLTIVYVLVFGIGGLLLTRWICRMPFPAFLTAAAPGATAAIAAALTARLAAFADLGATRSPALGLVTIGVPAALAAMGTLLLADRRLRRGCAAALSAAFSRKRPPRVSAASPRQD